MRQSPFGGPVVAFVLSLIALAGACTQNEPEIEETSVGVSGRDAEAVEAQLAQRISDYLEVLTAHRDADVAGEYYTEDARLVGPGMDMDRPTLVEGMRGTFEAGVEVQVNRRTLEVFVHGDAAYEIAQAEDVFLSPDGETADTFRNNMFIRWERGEDGEWRFDRVLLSPIDAPGQ